MDLEFLENRAYWALREYGREKKLTLFSVLVFQKPIEHKAEDSIVYNVFFCCFPRQPNRSLVFLSPPISIVVTCNM